jgi:D-glycero-alpha-D-manno-heptose-7-phosphate kinase
MIVCRTPFRISLFGGGTDYPRWFNRHGGAVVGTAIDKYCYVNIRNLPPFFEHKHRIVWSQIELVKEIDDIHHPAVRAVLADAGVTEGLEVAYNADLPARSGLGSSSSFIVGLLNALNALNGKRIAKKVLAAEAIRIEQSVMAEAVGSQDQIWAAYGGLNHIEFHADGTFEVSPLILPEGRARELRDSLMLFFTGFSRTATEIAEKTIANMDKCEAQLRSMQALVADAITIMQSQATPIDDLGNLLHQSWLMKRALAEGVTTPEVDEIYAAGMEAGAVGGKLLGAGGGGFMLFVVSPENQARVRERLKDLIHVTFDFDTSGSKIVVFEPDGFANT